MDPEVPRRATGGEALKTLRRAYPALLAAGLFLTATFAVVPSPVDAASLLPLRTETADTLPAGSAEAIFGLTYFNDLTFPAFTPSGLIRSQNLLSLPGMSLRVAAGGWAEIQAAYELLYLDEEARNGQTNWQYGSGDVRLHTKIRLLREREWRPTLGVRFGAKLPNADRSDRLGTDETDFGIDALASKDFGVLTAHLNMGLLLLGNGGPVVEGAPSDKGQDDLFNYGVAVASAPLGPDEEGATRLRLLAEVVGWAGSRFNNERSSIRFGMQMNRGPGTLYLGVSTGLIEESETVGVDAGFIYVFHTTGVFGDD